MNRMEMAPRCTLHRADGHSRYSCVDCMQSACTHTQRPCGHPDNSYWISYANENMYVQDKRGRHAGLDHSTHRKKRIWAILLRSSRPHVALCLHLISSVNFKIRGLLTTRRDGHGVHQTSIWPGNSASELRALPHVDDTALAVCQRDMCCNRHATTNCNRTGTKHCNCDHR